jgi:hypothetical protein
MPEAEWLSFSITRIDISLTAPCIITQAYKAPQIRERHVRQISDGHALRNSYCFRLRPSHAFLKERDPALHVQLKVPART